MHFLNKDSLWFPPPEAANEDGVLAVGGDLSVPRLLAAYRSGIFPWFNPGEPPIWWCPDPRFVIDPNALRITKSQRQVMNRTDLELRVNTAFEEVMRACAAMPRNEAQGGTWITEAFVESYTQLHRMGIAHSAECWRGDKLTGGLYGLRVGKVFCGESMFARESNASKYAFMKYAQVLAGQGVAAIDCQIYTPHLESLGGHFIARKDFLALLGEP